MKKFFSLLPLLIILLNFSGQCQNGELPLKSTNSILFGKDIIINNDPTQNQQKVAICSAFNGWLYSAIGYTVTDGSILIMVLKSTDDGITWSVMFSGGAAPPNFILESLNIIAIEDSPNIKLFISYVVYNSQTGPGQGTVVCYNGVTGDFEYQLFTDPSIYDLAISGDFMFPATSSNPNSVGVLYSKYANSGDSIIFQSSSNGGVLLDNRKVVAVTGHHFNTVVLTYGRSTSWNSGRYFAAWEERGTVTAPLGHIFSAHSEPNFNSSFTIPVKLDSIDGSALNNARYPSIACQYSNFDNDNSNFTEVVLFDKYISSQNRYDISGLYNKQATSSNNFTPFTLNLSTDSRQQPSVNFNPYDSSFMVTYYDSTTNKLPFLRKNFNMNDPNSWEAISAGYNDSPSLVAPYPRVALSLSQEKGACVWSSLGLAGKGVALFDSPYSTYTGVSQIHQNDIAILYGAYPNPANATTSIRFELKKTTTFRISLHSNDGREIGMIKEESYSVGLNQVKIDVSGYPAGAYYYSLDSKDFSLRGKIIVTK